MSGNLVIRYLVPRLWEGPDTGPRGGMIEIPAPVQDWRGTEDKTHDLPPLVVVGGMPTNTPNSDESSVGVNNQLEMLPDLGQEPRLRSSHLF